ncbi:hypothetical protein ISN44_As09g021250 [Arabidopsis suecica]|uniref:Uncharacterized protein n=1 Tax=Arabidopsis suecica TaxID=45249 RepID=A0A8T2AJW2_ARASU|nr:hypothetical protein ISN44_As09g021250 [Arabidopsis suecica]
MPELKLMWFGRWRTIRRRKLVRTPEQDHGGRPELKQGEILRTLATVEKDSQAIAESFSSLFVSLRSTLSEATGSSVPLKETTPTFYSQQR